MKSILFYNLLFVFFITELNAQITTDSLKLKASNNQNPNKWNEKLFEKDKEWLKNSNSKPLNSLAFPVEKYEYYVFNKPYNFNIERNTFSGISFGENIGGKEGKFNFKYEINLIFYTRTKSYQIEGDVSSRNYPYLTIQGSLDLAHKFDFVGTKSPDETGFLIINMKTFDLRFGKTILIFPNSDNSFYYLQLEENPNSNDEFDNYLKRLGSNSEIKEMIKLVK